MDQSVRAEKQTARAVRMAPSRYRACAASTQLYFIETTCVERHIKIGIAANVRARMGKMQMDCPYTLRLVKRVIGSAHIEAEIHARFDAQRIGGEWFERTPELEAFIESLPGTPFLEATTSTTDIDRKEFALRTDEREVRTDRIRPGVRDRPRHLREGVGR